MDREPLDLIPTRDAALRGVDIRSAKASVVRLRHGTYVDREALGAASPALRYEYVVRATVESMRSGAPLAHESAAVMLEIPIIGPWPDRTHVMVEAGRGGRSSARIVRHGTREMPDLVTVDGIAVVHPARTVVDLARTRSFASGLASADHVLRAGLVTREQLLAEVEKIGYHRGAGRARAVVEHADARAESVGESLSRAQMIELRLPVPVLQHDVYDADGFVGRTDFWWPELRLVGEFDGKVKFGREIAGDVSDARQALWREKQREDRLRRLGLGVVRWTWDEASDRGRYARLLARAGLHPGRRTESGPIPAADPASRS